MDEVGKLYREVLETAKLLKRSGALDKFFNNISDMDLDEVYKLENPIINENNNYNFWRIQDFCEKEAMKYANSATKAIQKAKFYANYVDILYQNYKSREKDIKDSDILKFIKDYENYYEGGEE